MANEAPLSFEASAFQCFVRGMRGVWRDEAYRGTVVAAKRAQSDDPAQIERMARTSPAYSLYSWLERHSQQFKYYGRWGIVRWMEERRDHLAKILDEAATRHPERLRLDPAFEVPEYVRAVDTHQHAGGIWGDAADAFAYETSSSAYSFSLFNPRAPMELYAATALAIAPNAKTILDLGCTAGNSTRALARAFPDARVVGIDVAAPTLLLGHLRSMEQGLVTHFRQGSAEHLSDADGSVDLVASHWLYHEMPPAAVRRSLTEARRVLKKGGGFMAYDMYLVPGGAIGRWLQAGYAARNNEPFAHTYAAMDMKAELEKAGFTDVKMRIAHPEPDPAVQAGELPRYRTHYMTMITARTPA
jgi:ubiquinone/menaquinone biosynthesis C-methylase UbiE